jgi:hypothetical protein
VATTNSFVAKFRGEVFLRFHAVAVNFTAECGIDCLACYDEFFKNNSLGMKENDAHALHFVLHLYRLFGLSEFGLSVCG